jgi:hypothetical protein
MHPVVRRLRAAAILTLLVGAFWLGLLLLYVLGYAALQSHPTAFLLRSLPELLPTVVAVSVAFGVTLAGGLYILRPKVEASGLSTRRAALTGALSTFAGYLALQATLLGGSSTWSWISLLTSAGVFSLAGAAAGMVLQRIAYRHPQLTGEIEERAIAP